MKKAMIGLGVAFLLLLGNFSIAAAQQGNSYEARSKAALNDCIKDYRTGNGIYEVNATLTATGGCAVGPATTGLRLEYTLTADPQCGFSGGPCPNAPSILLGKVIWCAGKIIGTECYVSP